MLISVSTMPAGNDVIDYVKSIDDVADFIHCDVCDGKYNSSKCFNPEVAEQINSITTTPLDVHLMTVNPMDDAKKYIQAGANIITTQIESFADGKNITDFIELCKNNFVLVGLSLEPETSVKEVLPYLSQLDLVLIMSVKTGKSGQGFQKSALSKIEYLKNLKACENYNFKIQVDGGINSATISLAKQYGADMAVSGSYVFNSKDRLKTIKDLQNWQSQLYAIFHIIW